MFCKFCGEVIDDDCIICPKCGKQVAELRYQQPVQPVQQPIYINNIQNGYACRIKDDGEEKNKWIAFLLCLFGGFLGLHKFYERKVLAGLIYLCTVGLFGFGWVIDCILILLKPEYYYV